MNASVMIQCYGTILEMIADRGMVASSPFDIAALRAAFVSETSVDAKNHAVVNACTVLRLSPSIALAFYRSSKVRAADIDACLGQLGLRGSSVATAPRMQIVVVLADAVNQIVSRQMASAFRELDFELWSSSELRFNFSRHSLVPQHELISDDAQIDEILASYRVPSSMMFPLISASDMMARYFRARPGQLMRITRTSPSAGVYVMYRRVV